MEAKMTDEQRAELVEQARELGRKAGDAAGEWITDGNTSSEWARLMVELIDEGAPEWTDRVSELCPNLSGEWADDASPALIFELVTGRNMHEAMDEAGLASETLVGSLVDELCDAWEDAAWSATQESAERAVRAAAGEDA